MIVKTSPKGIVALVTHEGVVPGPYKDSVGVLTYGVGHTKAAGAPNPATLPTGMPANLDAELAKVFALFKTDLKKYEDAVNRAIKVPVSQHEFDAAVSFHYNTGAIGKASWVKSLNAGNRVKAAVQIMNWKKPVDIIPRRKEEQKLFQHGIYPRSPATVWGVTKGYQVVWKAAKTLSPDEILGLMGGGISPDGPPSVGKPHRPLKPVAAVGAGVAAVVAGVAAFACKIPFLSSIITSCGG